jgi:hypothetical protein
VFSGDLPQSFLYLVWNTLDQRQKNSSRPLRLTMTLLPIPEGAQAEPKAESERLLTHLETVPDSADVNVTWDGDGALLASTPVTSSIGKSIL